MKDGKGTGKTAMLTALSTVSSHISAILIAPVIIAVILHSVYVRNQFLDVARWVFLITFAVSGILFVISSIASDARASDKHIDRDKKPPDQGAAGDTGVPVVSAPLGGSTVRACPLPEEGSGIVFHTLHTSMDLLPPAELPGECRVVSTSYASYQYSQKALYEVKVMFSLHNLTDETVRLYDIHARLYLVKTRPPIPYLSLGYVQSYRIDLLSDNSILDSGIVYNVLPKAGLYIDLLMESGYYDEAEGSLLVFGLETDVEAAAAERGFARYRIPSDKIYALQYMGRKSKYTMITALDGAAIQAKSKPIYPELMEIWKKHTNERLQKLE